MRAKEHGLIEAARPLGDDLIGTGLSICEALDREILARANEAP